MISAGSIISSLNTGLLENLKLFFITLALSLPLGLVITLGSMSHLRLIKYITRTFVWIIRGTPLMLQLFVVLYGPGLILGIPMQSRFTAAVIAFVINYAAYFSEIYRGGIESIPKGQFEAGRSLGFNYSQTMTNIIMPQAFKNVIPTLANEFIVLLKETSIAGYIALEDLTKGGDIIRSRTYSAFMPLMAVAIIYLALVMLFSQGVKYLERRLKKSER